MREKLKSPFRKLRNFTSSTKQGSKVEASSEIGESLLTEVGTCMKGAEDMRAKFEGFLANGQMICGAAYDFSRSLQDMAAYMMETFGDVAEEGIGNIFSLLAKVQFEMSKLLDLFAAHVSQTIIKPTETMMTKIQQAEIMKVQCDEKRKLYIVTQMEKQKGKCKRGKGNQASQSSEMAREGFKEQANTLILYMQSLIQGQSESLVTQAVKYHSAQMHLFSKGLASISTVEPMMRQLALDKVIDRRFSEEEASKNGFLNGREMDGAGKGSTTDSETDSLASSGRRLLVKHIEPPRYSSESSEEFPPKRVAASSKSAPISPLMHRKREGTAKESPLESAHIMYALPSPLNGSGRWVDNKTGKWRSQKHPDIHVGPANYFGEACKPTHITEGSGDAVSESLLHQEIKDEFVELQQQSTHRLKDISIKNTDFYVEDANEDHMNNPPMEKWKRYTQSGPLIHNARAFKNSQHANATEASATTTLREDLSPLYKSGPISSSPMYLYSTCEMSPPPSSMPQISELHKLPLPPPTGTLTPPRSPSHTPHHVAYSAPLGKNVQAASSRARGASPLPSLPCSSFSRSLSIPASTAHGPDTKQDF